MRCEQYPLQEAGIITDLFAEGLDRVEVLGDQVRFVFWRWKRVGCSWQRIALEWAMVLPTRSLDVPIEQWSAHVVRTPGIDPPAVH